MADHNHPVRPASSAEKCTSKQRRVSDRIFIVFYVGLVEADCGVAIIYFKIYLFINYIYRYSRRNRNFDCKRWCSSQNVCIVGSRGLGPLLIGTNCAVGLGCTFLQVNWRMYLKQQSWRDKSDTEYCIRHILTGELQKSGLIQRLNFL